MDTTFIKDRITAIKLQIVAYEDAILALGVGGIQSYTLDTGQTRQTVTKFDIVELQKTLDMLLNRLVIYETRLTGNGVMIGGPAW